MTGLIESILNRATQLERDLEESLEGMDCYLDMKMNLKEWSVR